MEAALTDIPTIRFQTTADTIDKFTSLLQAGILVPARPGVTIGEFLKSLPGFTEDYITDQIQTIFLNGTATDNMETPMEGDNPTLAISAAMPGLAGAIFRRNSLHAALRTVKNRIESHSTTDRIVITLKLFNAIARDRGAQLLKEGVTMKSNTLSAFLANRTPLQTHIANIHINGDQVPFARLTETLSKFESLHLRFCN